MHDIFNLNCGFCGKIISQNLQFQSLIMRLVILAFSLMLGFQASASFLVTSSGKIPLETLHGKWVFISYWATWCPPCIDEIDTLNAFFNAHQHENIALYAVNYDGVSAEEQLASAKTYGVKYPSLIENPARPLNFTDIRSLPALFVLNPEGKLQDIHYGGLTLRKLNQYFLALKKDFEQAQLSTQHAYKPSV